MRSCEDTQAGVRLRQSAVREVGKIKIGKPEGGLLELYPAEADMGKIAEPELFVHKLHVIQCYARQLEVPKYFFLGKQLFYLILIPGLIFQMQITRLAGVKRFIGTLIHDAGG